MKFFLSKRAIAFFSIWEVNLFFFAFLIHFVYEVWQSPYFEFYGMPSLADKINYITHCTIGDGVITTFCYWFVSGVYRSRDWGLSPTKNQVIIFTFSGWLYTLITEIYRVRIVKLYGILSFLVPGVGISWLSLLQWIILPPIVLWITRRQILGSRQERLPSRPGG